MSWPPSLRFVRLTCLAYLSNVHAVERNDADFFCLFLVDLGKEAVDMPRLCDYSKHAQLHMRVRMHAHASTTCAHTPTHVQRSR